MVLVRFRRTIIGTRYTHCKKVTALHIMGHTFSTSSHNLHISHLFSLFLLVPFIFSFFLFSLNMLYLVATYIF